MKTPRYGIVAGKAVRWATGVAVEAVQRACRSLSSRDRRGHLQLTRLGQRNLTRRPSDGREIARRVRARIGDRALRLVDRRASRDSLPGPSTPRPQRRLRNGACLLASSQAPGADDRSGRATGASQLTRLGTRRGQGLEPDEDRKRPTSRPRDLLLSSLQPLELGRVAVDSPKGRKTNQSARISGAPSPAVRTTKAPTPTMTYQGGPSAAGASEGSNL